MRRMNGQNVAGFCVTDPESITGINATYISDTEITLTWDLPEGEYNAFEVKIHHSYNIIYPVSLSPSRLVLL
jgi:hypothetical protein